MPEKSDKKEKNGRTLISVNQLLVISALTGRMSNHKSISLLKFNLDWMTNNMPREREKNSQV
jgi:hypothetical protein